MSLHSRPRFSIPLLCAALCLATDCLITSAAGQTSALAELFQKGKAEFKIASYHSSLETFQKLDELSQKPGLEKERARLAPAISFYRGANLAALGRKEDARKEFQSYLAAFPRADLDRNSFPKPVVDAFEDARAKMEGQVPENPAPRAAGRDEGLKTTYARFRPPAGYSPTADERWANGPIRYLMTRSEKAEWDRIQDPAVRAAFIVKFWQARDPNPLTPENEFREEFEKRASFADVYFPIGERKGSETDRGLVFVLLGPPTYVAQFSLTSQDDPIQRARAAPLRRVVPLAVPNPRATTEVVYEDQTPLTAQQVQGAREIWHYGREQLPRSVTFNEVEFEFVTKDGYGTAVLQRDQLTLLALEGAARGGQGRK